MKTQLLNTPEDCQWLVDTALKPANLKGATLPAFRSFILTGNEDFPMRVELFPMVEPLYNSVPVCVVVWDEASEAYQLAIYPALTFTPETFLATFGTLKGRALANRLGLTGKGCTERANLISGLAGNAAAAIRCQATHGADPETGASYWAICARIAERMSATDRARISLPVHLV